MVKVLWLHSLALNGTTENRMREIPSHITWNLP